MRFLFTVFAAIAFSGNVSAQTPGSFIQTGDMAVVRSEHTATLLEDGRVLIAGGRGLTDIGTSRAELYDPSLRAFVPTGSMTSARWGHTATLLRDGRVLIAGGNSNAAFSDASAELYDPATGTFTATGALVEGRAFHAAQLLQDGKVLIVGGERGVGSPADAELYDPETGTFSLTAAYAAPLRFFGFTNTADLLPDGKVLIAGENPPEVFDPASDAFRPTGSMVEGVYSYGMEWHTSTSLRDGTVLITGGNDDETCGGFSNAEIYDPATGTFSVTGSMTTSRDIHTATLLHDGTVLVTGGGEGWCFHSTLDSAEVYDPARRSFFAVGKMMRSRSGHTATLLNDGTVLIAGGFSYWPAETTRSAEIYRPPTQFPGRRRGRQ